MLMKFATAALALVPILGANAVKILQVNDDGWAEQYLRALNNALRKRADYNVVLSAPAENKSGTGKVILFLYLLYWLYAHVLDTG